MARAAEVTGALVPPATSRAGRARVTAAATGASGSPGAVGAVAMGRGSGGGRGAGANTTGGGGGGEDAAAEPDGASACTWATSGRCAKGEGRARAAIFCWTACLSGGVRAYTMHSRDNKRR